MTTRAPLTAGALLTAAFLLLPAAATPAAAQTLLVEPAAVDFGVAVVGQPQVRIVLLYNAGLAPAVVQAVGVSGPHAAEFVPSAAVPSVVAAGAYTFAVVTFTPQAIGTRAASLSVTWSGGAPLSAALSGVGATSVEHRVNAGGGAYVDPWGNAWAADAFYNTGQALTVAAPIAGTFADPLFQSERFDPPAAPEMTYSFPVPSGLYVVRLLFAETYAGAAAVGARVFDVAVEGQTALDDYDIFAKAGFQTAVVESVVALVADGSLDVQFKHGVENPKVSAIEIACLSPPGAWLLAVPSPVEFGPAALAGGGVPRAVLLLNLGRAALTVSDVAVGGPAAGDFAPAAQTPLGVAPGAWAPLPITFTPQALGERTATLSIASNDPAGPRQVVLRGQGVETVPVQFTSRTIASAATPGAANLANPTSLMFGPDGRLYVAQQNGLIHVLTLDAEHDVVDVDLVTSIFVSPTFNENGTPAVGVFGRQVTGLYVDPGSDPLAPVLYVAHSDPRIGTNNDALALAIDTDGGVLTRLVGPDFDAPGHRTDLVRGLPRSRENHAPNGIQVGPDGWLYLSIGGNTNYGAPSTYFSNHPEVNLSAAVVRLNLAALPASTLDVSAGAHVGSGPGQGEIPGVFELYATGYRNGYDLLWHSNGRLYLNANEGNLGLGNTPGPADGCPGGQSLNPGALPDKLFVVTPGAYGGHPVPARGHCVYGDGSAYSPPLAADPAYTPPLFEYPGSTSTNGLAEYSSLAFGGQMLGDLITVATFSGDDVRRLELSPDGSRVLGQTILAGGLDGPIDVAVHPDGTIFVAELFGGRIIALEPAFAGPAGDNDGDGILDAEDPDDDNDGYTDADELANGTNPLSPASVPADFDGDFVSDALDPDDDGDGVADAADPFALDPANGANTIPPFALEWNPGDRLLDGLDKSGFTGVQPTSGGDGFLPGRVSVGAAGGFLAIVPTPGDMRGAANDQDNALQVGIDAAPVSGVGPFTVSTRLVDPFVSPPSAPLGAEGAGLFLGLGEDDYARLFVTGDAGLGVPGIRMSVELDGAVQDLFAPAPVTLGTPQTFDLFLEVDPEGQAITARYRVGSSLPADIRTLGTITTGALPGLGRFFTSGLGVGLAATRAGQAASSLVAVFDYFRITPGRADPSLDAGAAALMIVDTGGTLVGGSTFTPGSFRVANLSSAGQRITRLRLDLRTAWLPDLVFDPLGGAGDTVGKPFTVDVDQGVGLQSHRLLGSDGAGHRVLDVTFADFAPGEGLTFSIDVDPASIRGTPAPGPGESGSVSGLELIGSTVTAFFDDGSSHTAQLYRASGSDVASFAVARAAPLPAPATRILGVPVTPTQVQGATQTVQVIGSPGQTVGLLVIEGARHTQGLDPGAPPLGAFEANSAVAVREQFVTLDADGTVEVPIVLTRTGADGGLNHVFAAGVVPPARVSPLSAITVLELQP